MVFPTDKNWERLYDVIGIRDFADFIASHSIQSTLFPIKLVFILFTVFFFCAVIYFYLNSSYLRYHFTQDVSEFFSWQAYGLKEINKRWKSITKKLATGSEKDYKMAIIEADYLLSQILEDADYKGNTFEELIENAGRKILPNWQDVLEAHKIRNSVVHDVNYKLDINEAKKILSDYEKAVKNTYSS